MAKSQRDKVERRLGDDLMADEQVRHAVLAFRIGGAREHIVAGGGAIAGPAGQAVGSAVSASPSAAAVPELPMPDRCIVALTTHRLLIFNVGGFFIAAPGNVLYDLPLDRLARMAEPVVVGGAARVLRITIGLTDGYALRWEFPRLQIEKGRLLIEELRRHIPRG